MCKERGNCTLTVLNKCSLCPEKAVHYFEYFHYIASTSWNGDYCNSCFVKKLRGMVKVWASK